MCDVNSTQCDTNFLDHHVIYLRSLLPKSQCTLKTKMLNFSKQSFNFINTLSNSRDLYNSIQIGFLFRYYCIQFRFRAHMISFFSFYFVYRHSKLQDHHIYPIFPIRCNQIQSHRSAQDFAAVFFSFSFMGNAFQRFERSNSTRV